MTPRPLRRFARSEDGSATIQFALLLPLFLGLFLTTFELGMYLTRQMMLDRAVDMTIREVRIGAFADVLPEAMHEAVVASICENNVVMPNCLSELRLYAARIDPRDFVAPVSLAQCVDEEDPAEADYTVNVGEPNHLMYLRACALFDPFFPTIGLGAKIPRQSGDSYAIFSTSSYAVEPN